MWESDLLHPLDEGALVGWEPVSCTVRNFVRWELWSPDRAETASIVIGYVLKLRGPTGHEESVDLDALEPRQRQRLGSFIGRPIEDSRAGIRGRLTLDFDGGWRVDVFRPDAGRMTSHTFWDGVSLVDAIDEYEYEYEP